LARFIIGKLENYSIYVASKYVFQQNSFCDTRKQICSIDALHEIKQYFFEQQFCFNFYLSKNAFYTV